MENDLALDIVDLERYPIHALDRPHGAAFLKKCQLSMKEEGWCSLDDFIHPDILPVLTQEALDLLPRGENLTITRNIYGEDADETLPDGDPRRREMTHHPLQLAGDQIPHETVISRLYRSDLLTDFVRRVQGKPALYRLADRFQDLNIVALNPGAWHAWHYDYNECTVTLLLQPADDGGAFMFLPNVRDREKDNLHKVRALLAGDTSYAKTFGRGAGTFTLFRGEASLHGVTRVEGRRPRVTAIFTYDVVPDRVSSDELNIRIYGERVAKILSEEVS